MVTNEERREIANWLRDMVRFSDSGIFHATSICSALGMSDVNRYAPRGHYGSDDVMYLADLIEPEPERTCNVIFRSHELSQTQTALVKSCSGCGFEFGTEIKNTFPFEVTINSISIPNYCPNCGAKVVEND